MNISIILPPQKKCYQHRLILQQIHCVWTWWILIVVSHLIFHYLNNHQPLLCVRNYVLVQLKKTKPEVNPSFVTHSNLGDKIQTSEQIYKVISVTITAINYSGGLIETYRSWSGKVSLSNTWHFWWHYKANNRQNNSRAGFNEAKTFILENWSHWP